MASDRSERANRIAGADAPARGARGRRNAYAACVHTPRATKLLTKSTLVTVSHAIEQAALAVAEDGPMLVLALFQRLPYYERERDVYEQIAARAATTVVGLAGSAPALAGGPHVVLLDENEELAREWTVVVLTPRFGAVLVAHDREQVTGSAATLEAGRLFDGWWSLRRDDALHETLRLLAALGDRVPPAERAAADEVLARVRDVPAGVGESRSDAIVRLLVQRAERTGSRLARARAAQAQRPAVAEREEIRRWAGEDGVTASGTLPVALIAVRVPSARRLPEQAGRRSGALRNEGLIALFAGVLRDTDRVTRLADDDFLLMLPAVPMDDALQVAHRLQTDLAAAAAHNPFLPPTAHVVAAVTRHRPFPAERLREALAWAQGEGVPVAKLDVDPV